MSALERRMQVLLDQDRYRRLEAEAQRRNQSVGATVRDAIDLLLDSDAARRLGARKALLDLPTREAVEPEFDKEALLAAAVQ
ncbi:MAG: antitoxin [Actinobacteria bacterium]|nr:antitoxin [Actinomycetota bacterium]